MFAKRFRVEGEEWEVAKDGTKRPGLRGSLADADWWGVTIRCVSDPSRPSMKGLMRDSDLDALTDEQLARVLHRQRDPFGDQTSMPDEDPTPEATPEEAGQRLPPIRQPPTAVGAGASDSPVPPLLERFFHELAIIAGLVSRPKQR